MKRLTVLFVLMLATTVALPAQAQNLKDVLSFAAGANGAWFDGPATAFPADLELGGNGAASLSQHISAVGAVYYGFDHSYIRWSTGGRITVSDVNDPNFSVGLGLQYHGASEADVRPNEWAPDATFGWTPWPKQMPKLGVIGQGSYGLTSSKARAILGLRYALDLLK